MDDISFRNSFPFEANAIELLGYAQNDIVEAKNKLHNAPQDYFDKLNGAYLLLQEVQEALYKIK